MTGVISLHLVRLRPRGQLDLPQGESLAERERARERKREREAEKVCERETERER